jgi:Colicin immunity protein / pyocin immunity protein.
MKKLSNYTESEFLSLVQKICSADCETEEDGNFQVREFEWLAEHTSDADLIFYPENGKVDSPEGVVQEVKEWRQPHGKPCFKSE